MLFNRNAVFGETSGVFMMNQRNGLCMCFCWKLFSIFELEAFETHVNTAVNLRISALDGDCDAVRR